MSLAYAILGLLQQQQRTGYELKTNCFDRCIAHFWPADQAQIYKTLDKLVDQGWITCTVEIQSDRPNRKIYNLTETGKTELLRWLQSPQPFATVREPLLVQLFFAAQLPNEAIIYLLEKHLTLRLRKLKELENIQLPNLYDQQANREQVMQRLVLDLAIRREQTYIDWLKTAIDVIHHQQDYLRST
jgi:DNA-binding PadR family transcriptional regulator